LTEVDKHVEAHRAWLAEQYTAGHFLVSGPQRPRTGGFILAAAMDRSQLDEILSRDPFNQNDAADYEVIDFAPVMTAQTLVFLQEKP
jgi:uncharacterized protein YciI